jgi:PAS domain S-box-containing protein
MKNKSLRKIFIGIVIPAILAISLFFASIWLIIIPIVERNMMESKKEMISELTHTAWSLIDEYYHDYLDSIYTLSEAQQLAASKVELMRYGDDAKDYFWITDTKPVMIMHPYRVELNNKDLSDYTDPNGTKLFLESVEIVQKNGEGYIDYYWQWKDDTSKIVPKLSYVKGFPAWDWIVGTGIYIEDVRAEISGIKNRLIRISLVIALFTAILLLYIIRQTIKIENKRLNAEDGLKESRERYKALVEASTDGTLLLANSKIIYSNHKFNTISGYDNKEILGLDVSKVFSTSWDELIGLLEEPGKSVSFETIMHTKEGKTAEIVLSLSKTYAQDETRIIVNTKEIGTRQRVEKAFQILNQDLQSSLSLMNQPITDLIENTIECNINSSIGDVAKLMTRKKSNHVLITDNNHFIGIVNDSDLKKRVMATELSLETKVATIMSAPVISINENALLSEVFLKFSKHNISHLIVKNNLGSAIGVISKEALFNVKNNVLSYLLADIKNCENEFELTNTFSKLPAIVNTLLESGANAKNITRIISAITDEISESAIKLTIEEIGLPPCDFAFIVLGSEGRREQTLKTDQDNAIIYSDKHSEEAKQYFAKLAKKVNDILNSAGLDYCKGEIMARNPEWNQSLSKWKDYFAKWINKSDPQSILDATIFFDLRLVYGDKTLFKEIQKFIFEEVKNKSVFFHHMADVSINIKLPSIGNNTDIDLKKLIMPISGFARTYSLKFGLKETNTLERLEKAFESGQIPKQGFYELGKVYNFIMNLRLLAQSRSLIKGDKPSNLINTETLTEFDLNCLKKSTQIISEYQTLLSADFKGII